ncbi:hypothetical protein D3C73_982210 [compost metagenome]
MIIIDDFFDHAVFWISWIWINILQGNRNVLCFGLWWRRRRASAAFRSFCASGIRGVIASTSGHADC